MTTPNWAALPLDAGTRAVICGGMRVLFERGDLFSQHTKRKKPRRFMRRHCRWASNFGTLLAYFLCLKDWTSCSCFLAASRVSNVPRFLRFPVFESFFSEYRRYFPDLSFRIILTLLRGVQSLETLDSTLFNL